MPHPTELKHIAIAGNIGAGKTTLTGLLCKHFDWTPQYETTEENPYLYDFYRDMPRWSFNIQVYFLHHRLKQLLDIQNGVQTVVQDRTIYEDAEIFAPNLQEMGLMDKRDFDNYYTFFQSLKSMLQPPDLLIYLKASIPTLVDHIDKRGREYEENIRLDYLKRLNRFYDGWIEGYEEGPYIIVDINENHFDKDQDDLGIIISEVEAKINGLF